MAKTSRQNIADKATKQQLHEIKNGSIKKDKKPKFKNVPTGKVALVDNAKTENKNMTPRKNFQKNAGVKKNQKSPKEKLKQLEEKENSPKKKQNSSKVKQNISKGKTLNKSQNKQGNKKINIKELEEVDDSASDIGSLDGFIKESEDQDICFRDETSEDEEESDVPDIFGASLAEDSDIDDEDFEDEEEGEEDDSDVEDFKVEDEDEESEGEKDDDSDESNEEEMAEGIQSNDKNLPSNENDFDDDEDEDDDDDNDDSDENDSDIDMDEANVSQSDDEEDEDENEAPGLKALLGKSMTDDDDNDEDFNEENEEDEDEDEDENEAAGLKALLGKSMTDNDDDDEDFNEEDEDDDISDEKEDDSAVKVVQEKATKKKATKTFNDKDISKKDEQVQNKSLSPKEQEESNKRTIFIDNIPRETNEATLKKIFGQYGPIANLRFRSIIPKNPKMSKKGAAIKQDIHPKVHTVIAFINYEFEESAKKALAMNGKKFEGNYLNVQIVAKQKEHDSKKSVFLGNLKFGMGTNPIWEHFGKCGEIESVHLMRDRRTKQTKGFGYVNFKSKDAVALALKLNGTEVNNRPIRVYPYKDTSEKSQTPKNREERKKRSPSNKSDDNRPSKKFKKNPQQVVVRSTRNEEKVKQKPERDNASPEGKMAKSFQGQKSDIKNKKGNKFNKKKKELAGKLTAKPKKQKV